VTVSNSSGNSQNVILVIDDGIATITLNRPDKSNAMSPELMDDLANILQAVARDNNVRAVVITGTGRSFSAGGDIKKDIEPLGTMTPQQFDDFFHMVDTMYLSVLDMEKPVIAAINGYAVAGGLELALCCDIRIAADDAHLGAIFVRMGLCPEVGLYLMPRLIGLGRSKLLAMTGNIIDAKEAERIGLVDMVVPADSLLTSALSLASKLAHGPRAIGLIKKAINDAMTMELRAFMTYSKRLTYELAHTADHKEALEAFLMKRPPNFRGE